MLIPSGENLGFIFTNFAIAYRVQFMVNVKVYLTKELEAKYLKVLNSLRIPTDNFYSATREVFNILGEPEHLEVLRHLDVLVEQKQSKVSPAEKDELLEQRELTGLLKARERGSYEQNLLEERKRRGLTTKKRRTRKPPQLEAWICKRCGETFERHKIPRGLSQKPVCPNCESTNVERLIVVETQV